MSRDTGGPAFPNVPSDVQYVTWDEGMTLRDYFAAKAMQSIPLTIDPNAQKLIASESYQMADAMLAERNK